MSNTASVGYDLINAENLPVALGKAKKSGYHFAFIHIANPRYKREFISGKAKNREGPFTRTDLILPSSEWNCYTVGKISAYIDVDSNSPRYRQNSEEALNQELTFASHLVLPAITFRLKSLRCTNLARIIYNKLQSSHAYQIWVQVPMKNPLEECNRLKKNPEDLSVSDDSWEWWNKFRTLCNSEKRIGVALEVPADLPDTYIVDRWLGEPVKCLIFPTSIFLTNKGGYPVMSPCHKDLLKRFSQLGVQVLIQGADRHYDLSFYFQYIDHLFKNFTYNDPLSSNGKSYEDQLQCPLQPLSDNLDSNTYEIFEKDPVKYKKYQEAIEKALIAKVSDEKKDTTTAIVMVVGAGRGPLIRATLNAAEITQRKVKIYAVEKNPNAIVALQAQIRDIWPDNITIVAGDMRLLKLPELADILVSELLGSFGDNELSPECLDGAQALLKPDGISIPCSYTSYICPIQSPKLYAEARDCKDKDKLPGANFEMPYVVHIVNKYVISPNQPLFTFKHPNWSGEIDNRRSSTLRFDVTQNCVLHGFSGYFDTVLYDDVMLSIRPETHSVGMFSWFAIYFPIRTPIQLKAGETIVFNIWRCCTKQKVWYEWAVSEPEADYIHNSGGRYYTIGLM